MPQTVPDVGWHKLFEAKRPGRRFALDSPAQSGQGQCVTVASQKGGVGKTTTVVNLAAGFGLAGQKALLIDLDPQANATSGVGEEKLEGDAGGEGFEFLRSLGGKTATFLARVRETQFENLWICPSFDELSSLEMVQMFQRNYISEWKHVVAALRERFDLIIIDCPPSLGGLPNLALSASDRVIIPVQCEYYAMEGLSQILPVIEELGSQNPGLEIGGLLLTMYSSELELSRDVAREIRQYFPGLVFDATIPRDVTLAESSSHGVPALYYDFYARGAWSYLNLTKEVLRR